MTDLSQLLEKVRMAEVALEAAEQQVQRLTAENERMRGVLRPFARIAEAEDYAATPPGKSIIVNVDLCRDALDAISKEKADG